MHTPEQIAMQAAAIRTLNEALAADPAAVTSLVTNRVPCNATLCEHPTIQAASVTTANGQVGFVGMLGIINGILGAAGAGLVAVHCDIDHSGPTQRIVGFAEHKP